MGGGCSSEANTQAHAINKGHAPLDKPTPYPAQNTQQSRPVVQEQRGDMYKSFKADTKTDSAKPTDKQTAGNTQTTADKPKPASKEAVTSGQGADDMLPWKEALDKVSSMELWDGKPREERDHWGDYLTRADELVRKPRKTIPQDVVRAILEGDMTSVDMSAVPNAQPRVAVFVSSTFTDTKAERNHLMKDVYPYLRLLCRRLGVDFGTVDMRWGVTEEATNDNSTTDMCVKEIHRCMKDSAGPAFLCLLGHKYGYRPLPAKIVHTEYEAMLKYLQGSGTDTSLITSYYQRDDNAVPAEYALINKTKENTTWWDDVEKIQANFRVASVALFGETDKRCDKYHISVTETEIHNGVFDNPNADYQAAFIRRDLQDYTSDFHKNRKILDMAGKQVDEYAQQKMSELKETKVTSKYHRFDIKYDKSSGADCANYIKTVCDEVCRSLTENILDSYAKRLHVKEDLEFQEASQHRDHANEKASLFVGREREIGLIKKYLASDNSKPLVVHGPSGCGKTALMAVSTKLMKSSKANGVVVLRFLGTTGLSGSARNVMISVCTQLSRVYGQDVSKIPAGFKDLIKYFRTCMGFATAAKPLFLVLDSLDQLSNEDFGQNLAWLSLAEELPENVKLVVSSLPTKCLDILKSYLSEESFVEVQLLQSNEGPEIIKKMLELQHRKVTDTQSKIILDAFKKCPLPLFLRLAVDIALQWHSYDDVSSSDVADDMPGLITMLFDRLESRFGEMFVHHALSYITASKHGLSLAELEDILSCDDQVLDSVFEWWIPPIRRIPPLLWARVRNELGIYLAERGTNGVSAYGWYHRQFWETAEKRYLENTFGKEEGPFRQKAHAAIADYFDGKWEKGKPHVNKKDGTTKVEDRKLPKQPIVLSGNRESGRQLNRRKFAELPYHLIQLGEWDRFQSLVMDLKYIEADFESGNGFNCLSELIEATKLSGRDTIKQMTRFVGSNLGFLVRESKGVYQMALQQSKRNIIRKLLGEIKDNEYPVQLMTNIYEEDFNDPCEMTLQGHTETIRTCDYSPKGDLILSSADDSTMRIWDATTGAELVCVSSLAAPVWPAKNERNQLMLHPLNHCCFSRDGETIGSGSEQGQVMLWDKSGGQIKCVETSNLAVTFVQFSRDNKVLATCFKNSCVSFWAATDLQNLGNVEVGGETTCLDWSIDGNTVAVMCLLGMVLIDTRSYSVRANNPGGCYQNLCCVYHPEGRRIMSGGDDSKVSFWDAASGVFMGGIKRHNAWIWSIKFTKDGNNMFTCSSDRSMKVWHRNSGDDWEVTATVGGHSHRVSMVALEGITENKLVTSSLDRSLKVWDTQALIKGDIPPAGSGHFTTCVTSPSGRYMAKSQGWFKACTVTNLAESSNLGTTAGHTGFVREAMFSHDDSRLFVLDYGHSGTYEADSEKHARIKVTSIPSMGSACSDLGVSSPASFALSSQYLFVGTGHGDLHLYDLDYNEVQQWSSGTNKLIFSAGASRDSSRFAACYETICQVWDASASHHNHVKDLVEHDSNIQACAFSPDGKILVTGTNSGWLYAYNTSRDDCQLLTVAKDHASYIYDIVFSTSGSLMVSTACLSMRIWDVGESISLKCTYFAPVNRAGFIDDHSVVVGEATGRQLFLSF